MKILMMISELGYGGAEGAFIRLARELAIQHCVEIAVFKMHYPDGTYARTDAPTGLLIHQLDNDAPTGRLLGWWRRWARLRQLKRSLPADVTISFLTGPNLLNALTPGPGRKVASARGSRRYEANTSPGAMLLYRWVADPLTHWLSDSIICVSEGVTIEIGGAGDGSSPHRKFKTIAGYVDSGRLIAGSAAPIEPEFEPYASLPTIIAAGRQSREKGFLPLIDHFAKVQETISDAKLILIGDGPQRLELEKRCETLGLIHSTDPTSLPHVVFAGYRTDPNRYFRLARLFAFPSLSEGLPNLLIEALAAGIPIIASDSPWGAREVMGLTADRAGRPYPTTEPTKTEYGLLMPRVDDPRFSHAWVKTMYNALTHPETVPGNAESRRERSKIFDCSLAGHRWSDHLQELLGS